MQHKRKTNRAEFQRPGTKHRSHVSGARRLLGGKNKHWIGDVLKADAKRMEREIVDAPRRREASSE